MSEQVKWDETFPWHPRQRMAVEALLGDPPKCTDAFRAVAGRCCLCVMADSLHTKPATNFDGYLEDDDCDALGMRSREGLANFSSSWIDDWESLGEANDHANQSHRDLGLVLAAQPRAFFREVSL